ncbi:MAG: amidohydrolase family protein [Acidobacteriaceae bacterium]|nr:amidohydrolase family protein [Acidobacteriaceae bacterium]
MRIIGFDPVRQERLILDFDALLSGVTELLDPHVGELDYIAPGFIDLQVNGYDGVDYNSPATRHEDIARSLHAQFACGVTRLLPTVITGTVEGMRGSLANLYAAKQSLPEGVAIEGFHVEGPHISAEEGPRGAHPLPCVRPPDIDEFKGWQEVTGGLVKLVTISPEWPEAPAYIEAVVREGVVVAIGHTGANSQQIQDAVAAGATLSTHLGNGSHGMLPRHPNYLWDQLADDRLTASLIGDGIHIGESFLRVAVRAKGVQRSILVTDASAPAGAAPGRYQLGDQWVDLTPDDRVVLAGQSRLAGSALKMHRGVENLVRMTGITLGEAITMATRNPARVGRISGRQRGLTPGDRADFVVFSMTDGRIEVQETWISGQRVYLAP